MALVEIPDDLLIRLYTQRTQEDETALMRRLDSVEERMTEMSGALQEQRDAITNLATRIDALDTGALQAQVATLTQAIADKDAAAQALADAEAAEDVLQDAERDRLTAERDDATSRVDAALADVQASTQALAEGVSGVQQNTADLNRLAQPPA